MTFEAMSLYSGEPASEGCKPLVKEEPLDTSTQDDIQPDRKSRLKKKMKFTIVSIATLATSIAAFTHHRSNGLLPSITEQLPSSASA